MSRTLKVNGLFAFLGLEISFREGGSAQRFFGCEALSNFCVIFRAILSHAPFPLFGHERYQTFSCQGPQKHQ